MVTFIGYFNDNRSKNDPLKQTLPLDNESHEDYSRDSLSKGG